MQQTLPWWHGNTPALNKKLKVSVMTYQASAQEFAAKIPARGLSISSAPFMSARRAIESVAKIFKNISNSYVQSALASSRMDLIQKLNAKSDAELADLGLKRDEIVRFAFRDLYHI